jgi:ureidoacrylate peracid hydrolase
MHPTTISPVVIERLLKRRGRIHAFEVIDPFKTALVVIDMQNGFCAPGSAAEIPVAREIVPNINRLASATRKSGGIVAWVKMTIPNKADWPVFMDTLVSEEFGNHMLDDLRPGSEGNELWPELQTEPEDIIIRKNRFSAFLPSACDLPRILREKSVDTVIIVGTLTNVCSESSGRDAAMSDFKTILVSDGNACRSDDDHLATLHTFITVFGDVRTTDEVIHLLQAEQSTAARAAE